MKNIFIIKTHLCPIINNNNNNKDCAPSSYEKRPCGHVIHVSISRHLYWLLTNFAVIIYITASTNTTVYTGLYFLSQADLLSFRGIFFQVFQFLNKWISSLWEIGMRTINIRTSVIFSNLEYCFTSKHGEQQTLDTQFAKQILQQGSVNSKIVNQYPVNVSIYYVSIRSQLFLKSDITAE